MATPTNGGPVMRVARVASLRQVLLRMEPRAAASKLVLGDRPSAMSYIKGPAIDPEAFRVEGHCCGIRLPALKELTGEGLQWEFTPETKAELVAAGVLPAEAEHDSPKTSQPPAPRNTFSPSQ
jgi:hypothetical protein